MTSPFHRTPPSSPRAANRLALPFLCLFMALSLFLLTSISSVETSVTQHASARALSDSSGPPFTWDAEVTKKIGGMKKDLPRTASSRPPLESLIQDRYKNVTGDPQFLLDFAIVGYPKCGTGTMKDWLRNHPEAQMHTHEMQSLSLGRPAHAIEKLYKRLPEGDYKRGYKSPFDITNKGGALDSLQTYWPQTKLIVGVRHPILWFQSFYNFRVMRGWDIPEPNQLLKRQVRGFSVAAANFHVFLSRLGKTNMTAPEELEMKREFSKLLDPLPPRMPNKVFLYVMEQLADKNETRTAQFRRDLQAYLGFKEEIPPLTSHNNQGKAKPNDAYIDICDSEYDNLRKELLKIARCASIWIRKYFLASEDVTVSSREYVEVILESWMHDPCDTDIVMSNK